MIQTLIDALEGTNVVIAIFMFVQFGIFNYIYGKKLSKSGHEDTARKGRHIILRFWYGVCYIIAVPIVLLIGDLIWLYWLSGPVGDFITLYM